MKSLSISTSFRQLVAKSGPCTLPRDLAEVSIGFPYDGFISIATRRFWHGEINGRALKPGILRSENMWPLATNHEHVCPKFHSFELCLQGPVSIKKTPKTRVRCKSVWEIQNSTLSGAWSGMGNDL